ncbi:MAG: hypothetical protein IJ193_08075 [Bacilli bacterium]|nr:hypothetical protein [Bacilli bacterium]
MYININGKITKVTKEEYEALVAQGSVPASGPASKMDELIAAVHELASSVSPEPGEDTNTTYTLTKEGNIIKLTGSDGSENTVEVADTNTTYTMSLNDETHVLTLTDNEGNTQDVELPEVILSQSWDAVNREYGITIKDAAESEVVIQYHLVKDNAANQIILKAGDKEVDKVQLAADSDTKYSLEKVGNEIRLVPSDGSEAIVIELDPDINTTYTLEFNDSTDELSLIPNDNSLPQVISLAKFADADAMEEALATCADKQETADALAEKANKTDVDTALAEKADKSEIPDISDLVTTAAMQSAVNTLTEDIDKKADKSEIPDVTGFATTVAMETALQSKADVSAIPDVSGFAVKTDVDTALAEKADKSDLPDLTPYAKTADVETALNDKVSKDLIFNGNQFITENPSNKGVAKIWNEAYGGGVMFTNTEDNVRSFVGVNDGAGNNIFAQLYAVYNVNKGDQVKNVGTRLNVTPEAMYYTEGRDTWTFTEDDKLVTKKDIPDVSEFVTTEEMIESDTQVAADASAEVNALKAQIDILTKALKAIKTPDAEEVVIDADVTDNTKDIIVSGGSVDGVVRTVNAKSIDMVDTAITSGRLAMSATNDVSMTGVTNTGSLAKTVSNAAFSINNNGDVTIKDCELNQIGYNSIEIGLAGTSIPKNVVIDNIAFNSKLSNNAITIFAHQKNAEIVISNCHFVDCSNPVRISNRENLPAKIKFINCVCDKWEEGSKQYAGFLLLQDYTSKTAEEAEAANRFANLEIVFENCYGPGGMKIEGTAENLVGGDNQVVYMYRDKGGIVAYDATKFPKITAY